MALREIKLIVELYPAKYVTSVKPKSQFLQVQRCCSDTSVGRHHDFATLLGIICLRTEMAHSPEQLSDPLKSCYDEQTQETLKAGVYAVSRPHHGTKDPTPGTSQIL